MNASPPTTKLATLAGGCFWCLEAVYQELRGVLKVVSGYAGGHVPNPSYRAVCDGTTGHAEVVQLTFDPQQVSYADLLAVFFVIHDPTTLNRQGADVGPQYRSAIYYHTPEQKAAAEQTIRDLNQQELWSGPIVTEVAPLTVFYAAEAHHQNYYRRNSYQGYCMAVINPKLNKFRTKFLEKLNK